MYSKIKRVSALLLVLVMLSSQNVLFPTSAREVESKIFSTDNCTITCVDSIDE